MSNGFVFYRALGPLGTFPVRDAVRILCARPCLDCGAPAGILCVTECDAAIMEVWRIHGALVTLRRPGARCPFCGEPDQCVGEKFTVRLSDGVRQYTIRHYGMMALGAYVVYAQYVYTGSWPAGSIGNETDGVQSHASDRAIATAPTTG